MTGDSKGASGPVGESPIGRQQDKRGVGPVFELREGLGWAHFGGPSILSEGDSLGVENLLGLIAGDDRAAATVRWSGSSRRKLGTQAPMKFSRLKRQGIPLFPVL
ncbi:hypothetical protein CK203_020745 [Vitis vinifera]|uniref:Uncharacterized protein n=1 Tax=Vitis vinifera TaxID=29760 RepID=A0A438IHX4_VITVI|nr:hypothetical protein CK203_020745 [Vitis vinifera]